MKIISLGLQKVKSTDYRHDLHQCYIAADAVNTMSASLNGTCGAVGLILGSGLGKSFIALLIIMYELTHNFKNDE
jgi:ERCC4-related helicase